MIERRILPAVLALAGLAGCNLSPAYHPPAIATPARFKEAGPWMEIHAPSATTPTPTNATHWWQAFGEAELDRLETRLASENPSLGQALARHEAAQARLGESRAELYPTLGAVGDFTANRQSANRPLRGANQPDRYGADTLSGTGSYELDLWGRVRASVATSRAEERASAADVATVRLALQVELASDYLGLRALDQQVAVLTETLSAYREADTLTRNRFAGGIADGIDVGRSGAQLADVEARLAAIHADRAVVEHAIASLIGVPATDFAIAAQTRPIASPPLPASLPSSLLRQRPDIAAAEQRMIAANQRIGVARAAFFPRFDLAGTGGVQSTALAGLGAAPNLFWSVGPSLAATLFDGGARKARVAEARAQWNGATATYRATVLSAFQQVEDALARAHYLGEEADAQARAAQAAEVAAHLSYNRYVKGVANYLDVVVAQTAALSARHATLRAETLRLQAMVQLAQATGGGWRADGHSG